MDKMTLAIMRNELFQYQGRDSSEGVVRENKGDYSGLCCRINLYPPTSLFQATGFHNLQFVKRNAILVKCNKSRAQLLCL